MSLEAKIASLESRIRELESLVGKPIVRQNLTQARKSLYVGKLKSGTTFTRGSTAVVVRHKVNSSGGTTAVSPTKEDTVADPGAIAGGPLSNQVLIYYALIDGVLTYTGHDCNG